MWCYLSGSQVHVCFNTISFTVTCFPTRLRSTVILWIHNAWKTQEKTSKLLIYWKIPATAQLVVSQCLLDTLRFGNSEHLCRVFENTAASQHDDLKARKVYDGLKSLRLSRFSLWEVCGRQREPITAPRQCTWLTIASKAAFGSKVNDDVVEFIADVGYDETAGESGKVSKVMSWRVCWELVSLLSRNSSANKIR